jgi:hypothetical protein
VPAATLIVMLKLKEGVDRQRYETFARETDRPTALGLPSIDDWRLYRAQGLVGADGEPPFDYLEVVQVNDTAQMARDMAGPQIARLSEQLAGFADSKLVLCEQAV